MHTSGLVFDTPVKINLSNTKLVHISELRVYKSELRVYKSELRVYKSELRVYKSELRVYKSELRVYMSELRVNKSELRVYKSELRVYISELREKKSQLLCFIFYSVAETGFHTGRCFCNCFLVKGPMDMRPVSIKRGGQWTFFTTFHFTPTGRKGNCMS